MRIIEAKDYADMSRKAAHILAAQVTLKPESVLGLATGSTPIGTYDCLAEWCKSGDLDFSKAATVNLDEYRGLDHSNDQSYYYFMNKHLYSRINIDPSRTHVPDGTQPDPEKEGRRYEELIRSLGGVDIQLLGIGHDGHIGFNEPGSFFDGDTQCGFDRDDHRGQQALLCFRRRRTPSGLHDGNRNHYARKKASDDYQRRG